MAGAKQSGRACQKCADGYQNRAKHYPLPATNACARGDAMGSEIHKLIRKNSIRCAPAVSIIRARNPRRVAGLWRCFYF